MEYNQYKCVAGGAIMDILDKYAHDYIKRTFKIKNCLFTKHAEFHFEHQMCDHKRGVFQVRSCSETTLYTTMYDIHIVIVDKDNDEFEYASANLTFVEKEEPYCKGE